MLIGNVDESDCSLVLNVLCWCFVSGVFLIESMVGCSEYGYHNKYGPYMRLFWVTKRSREGKFGRTWSEENSSHGPCQVSMFIFLVVYQMIQQSARS